MNNGEKTVLVLQGGGALGAYQAGAYEILAAGGYQPDWVAGISIGAINAALICGNPPAERRASLTAFWETITSELRAPLWLGGDAARRAYTEAAALAVASTGVPGFFRPRPLPAFWPMLDHPAASLYDTAPLVETLQALVDFDYLNDKGPRLSVGAVDVETGNFTYFDSTTTRIGPEHILASGALPPGFPAVEIDGRHYWDGGLVSNTPLQYVMESAGEEPLCVFQIDLFSARGPLPPDLGAVAQRQKDIQYSSRTRLTTDRYKTLHDLRAAALRLRDRLPKDLRDDPDLAALCAIGGGSARTLVHLIHRKERFETQSKDYEFSRLSMHEHWAAGAKDAQTTLHHPDWIARQTGLDGLQVFDLAERTP
ncbi:patatin-like phospholipase family protein [Pararhodobacter zhoushanensis]|uniref:Patatin-like phospholipase family protein n=1 Tax=Pararhodobacter zhoushanensis TaxID=2479545 RepID=A0ABT3GWT9_9RHOB|nr:patatin-like phospholipase family protein [Pararhodobacter zhoushanensis]MCW1932001.1 patatin-like phospholipase family protein [Pararhodobacter zhoushanensis]